MSTQVIKDSRENKPWSEGGIGRAKRRKNDPRKWYKQRYSWFCSEACFENTHLFQSDSYIREQFEHNVIFSFAYAWFCPGKHEVEKNAPSWTMQGRNTQNVCKHTPQVSPPPEFTGLYFSLCTAQVSTVHSVVTHTHLYLVLWFSFQSRIDPPSTIS